MVTGIYYNRTNACDKCGRKLFPGKPAYPRREYDEKGNWTGRWLCIICYSRDYRYRSNSTDNIKKSVCGRRTGNLNPNSNQAKGDIFEQLTCIWRGVKNLNIENDNYRSPIDHSRDPELGIIQTRGRVINRKWWSIPVEYEHGKEFDNLVFYCVDKGFRNIIRIYIIPRKEIENRNSVSITNDSLPRWYDEYRVDEEIVKKVNKIFHSII